MKLRKIHTTTDALRTTHTVYNTNHIAVIAERGMVVNLLTNTATAVRFDRKSVLANHSSPAIAGQSTDTGVLSNAVCAEFSPALVAIASTSSIPLFIPKSNDPHSNEWIQVNDLLRDLMLLYNVRFDPAHFDLNRDLDGVPPISVSSKILDLLESCSLQWSEQFIHSANKQVKFAFLSIGSKDGTITIWRFDTHKPTFSPFYQLHIRPQSGWCTKLSWSPWLIAGNVQYCYLISAYSDGAVYSHVFVFDSETNQMHSAPVCALSGPNFKFASVIKFHILKHAGVVRAAVSKGNGLLVWTAPKIISVSILNGTIVCTNSESECSSGKMNRLTLPIAMPVGGLTWSLLGEEIRIYSVDGKSFTVGLLPQSAEDKTTIENESENCSNEISKGVLDCEELAILEDTTAQFYKEILGDGDEDEDFSEKPGEDDQQTAAQSSGKQVRFYGAVSTPNGLADIILYTVSKYGGLEYITDKTDLSHLLIHWNHSRQQNSQSNSAVDAVILNNFNNLIEDADLLYRIPPGYLLWDIVMYSLDKSDNSKVLGKDSLVTKLLDFLREKEKTLMSSIHPRILKSGENIVPENLLELTPVALFSNPRLNCLRLQNCLYLASIEGVPRAVKKEAASTMLQNHQILLREYIMVLLSNIRDYFQTPHVILSDMDTLMITLISEWCLFNRATCPEAFELTTSIFSTIIGRAIDEHILEICNEYLAKGKKKDAGELDSKEECLACESAIFFSSPWKAKCGQNHPWDRCAVSLLTAATPKTRSCLGCKRKVISPFALESHDGTAMEIDEINSGLVDSKIMKSMLECMSLCLYCGNRLRH